MSGWVIDASSAVSQPHRLNDACEVRGCTPVAVIDPEDAEQVERLADAVITEGRGYRIDKAIVTVGLMKALNEFAALTPPRPEEPQGLGAVVEDADGERWVRWSTVHRCDRNWKGGGEGGDYREWKRMVHPVRVLSEGVS